MFFESSHGLSIGIVRFDLGWPWGVKNQKSQFWMWNMWRTVRVTMLDPMSMTLGHIDSSRLHFAKNLWPSCLTLKSRTCWQEKNTNLFYPTKLTNWRWHLPGQVKNYFPFPTVRYTPFRETHPSMQERPDNSTTWGLRHVWRTEA